MYTPKLHTFETTGEAYDASQTDDRIRDGDILHVPTEDVVGILLEAWPVAITEKHGEFHLANDDLDWSSVEPVSGGAPKDYRPSFEAARWFGFIPTTKED
jgi:hypothetical protein